MRQSQPLKQEALTVSMEKVNGNTPAVKGRDDKKERDPAVIQWRTIEKFLDPDESQIPLLTELSDRERRWMARHKAMIKLMNTPLYIDRDHIEGENISNPNHEIITIDGKKIVREWTGPVFLEEANYWYMVYGVSLQRKSRGEFLTALGKLGGNIMGLLKSSDMINEEPPKSLWDKIRGK